MSQALATGWPLFCQFPSSRFTLFYDCQFTAIFSTGIFIVFGVTEMEMASGKG